MEFLLPFLKVLISLGIVIVVILLLLPYAGNYLLRLKGFSSEREAKFKVIKVQALTRDTYVAEIEIKGRTYILGISNKGIEIIYKEDDKKGSDTSTP